MQDELLTKLDQWHEEDQFEEIVEAITEIPAQDRDYVLVSHLGRALNNLERYDEAAEQFLIVAEEGKDDPLWHYRIGTAYYYLDRYDDARREFEIVNQLAPVDEDALEFLQWIDSKTEQDSAGESEEQEESAAELNAEPDTESNTEKNAKVESGSRPRVNTDSDSAKFWDDREEAFEKYILDPPTDEQIAAVEERLVFRLPAFYIEMMKLHNGGIPQNRRFPLQGTVSGGKDHITISGILGIGQEKKHSLCGESGSWPTIENGGYPEFGVMFCDTPADSGIVMLDYRPSGNDGEPEVVYVDKESNYKVTKLADNFEAFIRGLVHEDSYGAGE
ncbi:SMI1/KNR4 family protein [Paenibacillus sp.]|jgi:tetratricopeptide (TPR) repeat protein|uniref:SMI1/KNR4 family protein n=1 Tax=Paenibacillus sp. TaxID=58172 RepID=UPI0028221D7B|nr:SMI1/KNR4 family protein [Paenibacillus sp.]MDR0267803.1 SMI1/KNR4 family protein [Paenibacillus sp.]